ncbi:MAG TPA: TonB-dependent receptor, partial [Gemmatimonadales bacterium]|nr:TonB-dependent receptor [Gemmatimonadales bacterium]
DQLVRNIRTNTGLRVPYLNRVDLSNRQPYRLNPYGLLSGWPTEGVNAVLTFVSERRLQGRWGLDWRPNATHRVTLGADGERTSLSAYQSSLISQAFLDAFVGQPTRLGVFASDRLTLGSAVLDLGVRYDRLTPGGEFPNVPGRIYTNPAWGFGADTNDVQYRSNVAAVFTRTSSKGALSPRIRFAYAVSPGTSVHLGYGRFVAAPSWATYFQLSNADVDFANLNGPFGRDVKFAVASQFDFGVRSAVGRDVVLDVAAYYKDLPLYLGRIKPFADPFNVGDTMNVNVVTLQSGSHGFGADARLDWRLGTWLTATTAYSFLRMHTDPTVPDGTTHALAAAVALRAPAAWAEGTFLGALARDLSMDLMLRATSGLPYTRLVNTGSGAIAPGVPAIGLAAEPINSSHLPWNKRLDMRLTKSVRAGGRDWTVYADLRNVLNFRNTIALFAETGGVVNDEHRLSALSNEYSTLKNEAATNGALEPDGATVNLTGCGGWTNPPNCVALTRVERRFGDGNGLYTLAEQDRALNAYYDAFVGPSRFYGSGRTLRFGVELEL